MARRYISSNARTAATTRESLRRSVEERVSEHAQGLIPDCYTFTRRPVKLILAEHYDRIVDAISAERQIKGWSRAKKEAYIRGDFAALAALAKRGSRGSD
jgi:putative endonuclease